MQPASHRPTHSPPPASHASPLRPPSDGNLGPQFIPKDTNGDVVVQQVRAFLGASEDVDIDVETVEDLMATIINGDQDPEPEGDGSALSPITGDDRDGAVDMDSEDDFDISALYTAENQAEQSWTKQEVKQMMHYLKEHGMTPWIKEYVLTRNVAIPKLLEAFGIHLCRELKEKRSSTLLYFLRVAISRELRLRERLSQYNTISDVVSLLHTSRRILILTGAGISVSCGIPDFRSRDGLYASLKDQGQYELDDPQQMFDIEYFRENPAVFYSFASQIYPSNFIPSTCHRFIKLVEEQGKLLRNYTQNIDTLETQAGVRNVLQCHGSFATATCVFCRRHVAGSEIEADILNQKVPLCTACNTTTPSATTGTKKSKKGRKKAQGKWDSDVEDESDEPEYPLGIMKPDITFFGEKLTDEFDRLLAEDRNKADLLLVIGTSLKVSPVAEILSHLPHSVPQILINRTPIRHINPDIVLLGNADDIVDYLCHELGWQLPPPAVPHQPAVTNLHPPRGNLKKRLSSDSRELQDPKRVGNSHVWLFDGAEGGQWVQDIEREREAAQRVEDSKTSPIPLSPGGSANGSVRREPKKLRVG